MSSPRRRGSIRSLNDPDRFPLTTAGMTMLWRPGLLLFLISSLAWSKSKEDVRNEVPVPTNFSAVVVKITITLSWQWPRQEELTIFKEFGYEIKRRVG